MSMSKLFRITRAVLVAIALPIVAFAFHQVFAGLLHPSVWFVFFPAIFVSAWSGGMLAGLVATAVSTLLVVVFLLPQAGVTPHGGGELLPIAIFVAVGVTVTVFHARVRAINVRLARAIAERERDLAERTRLESELAELSSELMRAQTVAEVGSWRFAPHTRELMWSNETYRLFGVPPGTPVSYDTFLAHVPPEDREEVHRRWLEALNGASFDLEHRIVVGGETRWVHSRAELHVNGRHWIGTVHDITARRRLEHELRVLVEAGTLLGENLDYEATLTNLAELVVRELADFCVIDVVREEVKRVKVASRDPQDAWIADELTRIRVDQRPTLLQQAIDSGAAYILHDLTPEKLATYTQSEAHRAALIATGVRSALMIPLVVHGQLVGVLGLLSKTRQYSPSDLAFVSELGRRAALSIEQARLYELAKRAIRSRDDVLGIVAHDLRNPLNTIRLQAELVRTRGGQPDRAASIDRAAMRMDRLIQDLLDVTRIEGRALVLERMNVATRSLLAELVDAQRPGIAAASLDLKLDAPATLPEVCADRNRVLQICENLIGNAVKFTPAGGQISVGAVPRDHEVLFWVADTGEGIASEDLPHVFDRFWQGRESHKRRGAGLGLAIVKGLVEAHGGRIWVESERDRGTTFFFTLPMAQPRETAVAAP
jgi:signal transduction histidine kinase/PAS domain-containing protein